MMMNTFSYLTISSFFACFFLSLFILKFGKAHIHKVWASFVIAVGVWELGAFFVSISKTQTEAIFWWRVNHIGIIFIPVFLFHVIYLLCSLKRKKILFFVYLQALVFSILDFSSDSFISGVRYTFSSFYYGTLGNSYHIFFIIWLLIVAYSHIELFLSYFKSTGFKKLQLKYFLIFNLAGFSGGLTNFLPAYHIDIYPYGSISTPIYCIISTYAILRYRLLDVNVAITRTSIFIAVYSMVLGIPFVIASTLRPYFIGLFGDKWWWVPMGLLTVLATVGPFVFIYINKKAEDKLLREQRQYQNTLRQASSGMIRVRELRRLLNLIVHVVTKTVRLEFASIFLLDAEHNQYIMVAKRDSSGLPKDLSLGIKSPLIEQLHVEREPLVYEEVQLQSQDNPNDPKLTSLEKQLKEIRAAVVIPSYVGNKMLGFIVLGKKLSGKIFSQDDLNVFSVLANQAALAIENAQFYEDIKETQEQLFQAEKMATVGTMADGLSHQINNRFQALSLITGDSMDILKNTDVSNCSQEVKDSFQQLQYAFQRIQANVIQGGEVVRGLLKYSRPGESGFENIDFNQVIDGALEMAQYKVRLSELDIQRNVPGDLPKIKCNLTQLEEVFFNLVDNAYDAIKERKAANQDASFRGKIMISAVQEDSQVRIVFTDNGMGVKDKDKDKLFTPFFTTKSSNKKGTGLGLYVIQKIVGFHEGTVSIDSTYNVGTKFEIVLPLSK